MTTPTKQEVHQAMDNILANQSANALDYIKAGAEAMGVSEEEFMVEVRKVKTRNRLKQLQQGKWVVGVGFTVLGILDFLTRVQVVDFLNASNDRSFLLGNLWLVILTMIHVGLFVAAYRYFRKDSSQ